MKIYNAYIRNSDNVGESTVSPLDYYDFPLETEKICLCDLDKYYGKLKGNILIYGGGGLIHIPSPTYANGTFGQLEELKQIDCHKIAWGVDVNVHNTNAFDYPVQTMDQFDLVGLRSLTGITSKDPKVDYAPCPSCKSSLFDGPAFSNLVHPIGIYEHAAGIKIDLNSPRFSAKGTTFNEAIHFIKTCRIIITNSYHAAYWSWLLGRKVVVFKPFSTKFYTLPMPGVVLCNSENDLPTALMEAEEYDDGLEDSRAFSDRFYNMVLNYIEDL